MSRRKARAAANAPEDATLSTNQRILMDAYSLYVDKELGLTNIAEKLDLVLLVPRRKITVLLIGNHSAGKSSFVNW
jgi:predicted GTPase